MPFDWQCTGALKLESSPFLGSSRRGSCGDYLYRKAEGIGSKDPLGDGLERVLFRLVRFRFDDARALFIHSKIYTLYNEFVNRSPLTLLLKGVFGSPTTVSVRVKRPHDLLSLQP